MQADDGGYKYEVGIYGLLKEESPYLVEWIEYHRMLGFQHFYLYDNMSRDNSRAIIDHYVEMGLVTCHEYARSFCDTPQGTLMTMDDYPLRHIRTHHASECRWVLFIDVDEFFVMASEEEPPSVVDFIRSRVPPDADAVLINWMMICSNGHLFEPADGLVIEDYPVRFPDLQGPNRHVKSLVRLDRVDRWYHPHSPMLLPGSQYVGGNGQSLPYNPGPFVMPPRYAFARVNHYYTKSYNYWLACKLGRMRDDNAMRALLDGDRGEDAVGRNLAAHYSRTTEWHNMAEAEAAGETLPDFTAARLAGELRRRIEALPSRLRELGSRDAFHMKHMPRMPRGWAIDASAYASTEPRFAQYLSRHPERSPETAVVEFLSFFEAPERVDLVIERFGVATAKVDGGGREDAK
jgi:hypothetical protein